MRAVAVIAVVVASALAATLAVRDRASPPSPETEAIEAPAVVDEPIPVAAPEPAAAVADAVLRVAPPTGVEAASAPTAPPHGPVRISVVGPTGLPVPGLKLTARLSECESVPESLGETDEDGRLVAADLRQDGRTVIATDDEVFGLVSGPDFLAHANVGLEMRVVARDAETGTAVRGVAWRMGTRTAASGRALVVPAGPGRAMRLGWTVDAPAGFVAFEAASADTRVSRYATTLAAAYPLRREAEFELEVLEFDGRPAQHANVLDLEVAGKRLGTPRFERFAYGVHRVRGVPFLRGEPVSIAAAPVDDVGRAVSWSGTLPADPSTPTRARIELPNPDFAMPQSNGLIGIGGGASGAFRGRGCGSATPPTGREGSVTAVARRRNGKPAAGATVRIYLERFAPGQGANRPGSGRGATLDADGRATFRTLMPQLYVVRLEEDGLVPCEATVDLPAKGDVTVELQEPEGGDVDVVVVDEAGRGLPFAAISVKPASGLQWLDETDGVQRVDPFVDERGCRRLAHVEPGALALSATFGTKSGDAAVVVLEGVRTVARIVLK